MFDFKFSGALKLAVATLALVSHAVFAAPLTFSGELTQSDPTFNRPVTLSGLSIVGTNVAHDVLEFHVTASGLYSIEATSFGGMDQDSYLMLYQGSFNPGAPLANLLALDDDSGVGPLSLISAQLQADISYFLVFSTYDNDSYGAYTGQFDTLSGPGQVVLDLVPGEVPEPGTLALIPLALAGMALARRRIV